MQLFCSVEPSRPEESLVRVNGSDSYDRSSLRMPVEGLVRFSTFHMLWTFCRQMVSRLLLHSKHVQNINWRARNSSQLRFCGEFKSRPCRSNVRISGDLNLNTEYIEAADVIAK
jgi:hypothetical protein